MTRHSTLMPGQIVPMIEAKNDEGNAFALPTSGDTRMTAIFFYRGVHCPLCHKQVEELAGRQEDFKELGVEVAVISMDDEERYGRQKAEWNFGNLPVGHDLSEASAREWGLYMSAKSKDAEPDLFAEPGIALVLPDGRLFAFYLQNVPFARAGLDDLLKGLTFILSRVYPIRGTA